MLQGPHIASVNGDEAEAITAVPSTTELVGRVPRHSYRGVTSSSDPKELAAVAPLSALSEG
ncbi:hypothetical protein ACFO9Q_19935 [Paenibacillus sp. GCM10023252]|uniref:hypothetical protein n=1 Tax=Paenibacillus sp. GCM10023252 TaxID=3252649 RepID=UPI00360EA79A